MENSSRNSHATILVHRLGSLGDMVVALPCFHLLRRAYPNAKIVLMTNVPVSGKAAPAMEVLGGSGLCDEAFDYPVSLRSPQTLLALRRKIKSYEFDFAVQLNSNREWWQGLRDHLFLRACGISRVVGTPINGKDMPFRVCKEPLVEQECSRLARRIRAIGDIDIADRAAWDLRLTTAEREAAGDLLAQRRMLGRYICASVGTKLAAKDWGRENWATFAGIVSKIHPQLGLVLVGAPDEFACSEAVRQAWIGPSINLCGKCSPRVSAAIFERAAMFIGHDSGPMHLATAVGIPVVAIFSWNNPPGQWYPGYAGWENFKVFYPPLPKGVWQRDLRLRRTPTDGILMIKPAEFAEACLNLLYLDPNS